MILENIVIIEDFTLDQVPNKQKLIEKLKSKEYTIRPVKSSRGRGILRVIGEFGKYLYEIDYKFPKNFTYSEYINFDRILFKTVEDIRIIEEMSKYSFSMTRGSLDELSKDFMFIVDEGEEFVWHRINQYKTQEIYTIMDLNRQKDNLRKTFFNS